MFSFNLENRGVCSGRIASSSGKIQLSKTALSGKLWWGLQRVLACAMEWLRHNAVSNSSDSNPPAAKLPFALGEELLEADDA